MLRVSSVVPCVLIFLLALAVRLLYIDALEMARPLTADAAKYMALAQNLNLYGVYGHNSLKEPVSSNLITPGYPLFLALLYRVQDGWRATYELALYIHAVMGALTVLLTYVLGRKFLRQSLAMFAALMVAFFPRIIISDGYLLTESLFAFLLMSFLWLFYRATVDGGRWLFLTSGLVLGVAILTRPVILLLPIFLIAAIYWQSIYVERRRWAAGLLLAGVLVCWLPWSWWSSHGAERSESNAQAVFILGTYPDVRFSPEMEQGYPYRDDPLSSELSGSWNEALGIVWQRIQSEPGRYFSWYLVRKPVMLWQWELVQSFWGPFIYKIESSLYDQSQLAMWSFSFYYMSHGLWLTLAFLGSLMACLSLFRNRSLGGGALLAGLIASIVAYVTAFHTLLAALPRFATPFYPLIFLMAAFAVDAVLDWLKKKPGSSSASQVAPTMARAIESIQE